MFFVLGFDLCIMKYHVKCNVMPKPRSNVNMSEISVFLIRKLDGKMLCLFEQEEMNYVNPAGRSCRSECLSCCTPTCGQPFPEARCEPFFHMHPEPMQKRNGRWSISSISVQRPTEPLYSDVDQVDGECVRSAGHCCLSWFCTLRLVGIHVVERVKWLNDNWLGYRLLYCLINDVNVTVHYWLQ